MEAKEVPVISPKWFGRSLLDLAVDTRKAMSVVDISNKEISNKEENRVISLTSDLLLHSNLTR